MLLNLGSTRENQNCFKDLKTIKGLKPGWFQALILFSYFLRVFLAMAMRVNTWYPTTAMRVALIIPLNAN
jgi:hypothetical protein